MNILIYFLFFVTGIFCTLLWQRIKEPKEKIAISENPKIKSIKSMLKEVKTAGKLSINLSAPVLMSLKEIAKTPDWDKKIDSETIENLYKIYLRWNRQAKSNENIVGVSSAEGFNKNKYWEGTYEEYKQDMEKGLIDANTTVKIIEYTGSVITMDEEGQMEEYME